MNMQIGVFGIRHCKMIQMAVWCLTRPGAEHTALQQEMRKHKYAIEMQIPTTKE